MWWPEAESNRRHADFQDRLSKKNARVSRRFLRCLFLGVGSCLEIRTYVEPELLISDRTLKFPNSINGIGYVASNRTRSPAGFALWVRLGSALKCSPRRRAPVTGRGEVRGDPGAAQDGWLWGRGGGVCAARSLAFALPDAPRWRRV